MWPTCLTQRKQPSSLKRLPLTSIDSFALFGKIVSAGPALVGGDSVSTWPTQEGEMTDHINVNGQGGTFTAYIARPKTSPASAVIVLQELFGVNADIRKHCDELAEQGFLAVAPDLFWRQEPGVDLTVTSEADWAHGLRLYGAYNRDAGAKDVEDTVDAVRNLPECNDRVAVLGYCLGALIVFLTAVRYHGID